MTWWCEMYRAWVRWQNDALVVVETEEALIARGEPAPRAVGRWIAEAVRALVREPA